ncbi:MAG TPA: hypothetical protein VFN36_06255, partial [Solirubrobacteraceae bacterium]|nr:hypothetical protein [Solirubrobacteraceae bacterium]
CHAEGREFESLQPLVREALPIAGFFCLWILEAERFLGSVAPTLLFEAGTRTTEVARVNADKLAYLGTVANLGELLEESDTP